MVMGLLSTLLLGGGGTHVCRRGANELVTFFPQPSKFCLSLTLSDILHPPTPGTPIQKSIGEQTCGEPDGFLRWA